MKEIKKITVSEFFAHKDSGALLAEYSDECRNYGLPVPNPDVKTYKMMESGGYMSVVGSFDGDDMTGFLVFLISFNPHYSTKIGTIESIFVAKKNRKGGAGLSLLNKSKELSKDAGASGMFISSPAGGVFGSVLCGLGLRRTNDVYFWGFE